MSKVSICHLYYDLMNLYGENGNIIALRDAFLKQGIEIKVDNLTINDEIDFSKYDLFFMGMGSVENQELVRKDILKYKKEINEAIENNKYFIMTGNSYELFGKMINDKKTLGIFNFESTSIKERISIEQVMQSDLISKKVIGFQNRGSINNNKENNLFKVIDGTSNDLKSENEGIHYKNFIGTYTFGPLLIRNPYLTDFIVKNILESKALPYKEILDTTDYQAYNEFIKIFNIK